MTPQPDPGARGALSPNHAALIAAALARSDLPPKLRDFLADVRRQGQRRPLSPKQAAAVERIAHPPPDYAAINAAALARLPDVLTRLLPGGRVVRGEYECADLRGGEGTSLRVNIRTGKWADFAVAGVKGGSPVDLAAAVTRMDPAEAARGLARMLGMEAGR